MNYNETLEWLYTQLPMYSRIGAAALKPNLDNTVALCKFLNDPHTKFKSVHVAGTNGKGSTCHMLAAVLQQAGYKVGLYTSPHLHDFKERIRVNGICVSEQFVVDFIARVKDKTEQLQPSFFEMTVAMAFEYFHAQKVDIAVIETGLGGLLDSTNIITPILSIITNIGTDHKDILGDTVAKIAEQKAGIIKENIPVVISEKQEATAEIFRTAATEKNSEICFAEDQYVADYLDPEGTLLFCNVTNIETNVTEKLRVGLPGLYQAKNICGVLASCHFLKKAGFVINEDALHSGLEQVRSLTGIRGRWEILSAHPSVVADVAHNKEGIEQVLLQAEASAPFAKKHFVLGFVKDKALDDILALFPANASYYFTNAAIPRALPAADLAAKALSAGLSGGLFENVNAAISAAKAAAAAEDLIIITGSFFTIGEIDSTHFSEAKNSNA